MLTQVVLIADDACKDSLVALVKRLTAVFCRYSLIATAHTGEGVQPITTPLTRGGLG